MGKTLISTSGLPGQSSGPKKTLITSINGKDGKPGEDAYQIAVENGFEGTEIEWLETLDGVDGKDAYEIALLEGFIGSRQEWLDFLRGKDGLSAYLLAVLEGFEGDQDLWLSTLEGQDGDDGYTPYLSRTDTHIQVSYVRDEEATPPQNLFSLESVRGLPGKSAYQSAVDAGFSGTEAEWVAQLKGKDAVFPNTQGSATTVAYGQPAELSTSLDPETGLLLFSAKIPAGKDGTSPAQPVPSVVIRDAADGAPGSGTVSGTYPNWNFEFFLRRGLPGPQGASGMPNVDLVGTGMPNGRITASPGTIYRDTVTSGTGNNRLLGTNGAHLWIKRSGVDSNDWIVLKGYTGRRVVNTWVVNGDDTTYPITYLAGNLWVERVDNTVIFSSWVLTSTTNLAIKPETGFMWQGHPTQSTARLTVSRWDNTDQRPLFPTAGRPILYHGGASPWIVPGNSRVAISGQYSTNDPWPTTLPGVAVNF